MFAIFVRLEKAKVGTRFRGYPPTKLLFFIMTRSDNLLHTAHRDITAKNPHFYTKTTEYLDYYLRAVMGVNR